VLSSVVRPLGHAFQHVACGPASRDASVVAVYPSIHANWPTLVTAPLARAPAPVTGSEIRAARPESLGKLNGRSCGPADDNDWLDSGLPIISGMLHVAEFRHAPAEVAPLHGIRAKVQRSLVGGQRFFIPPEPAQQVRPRGVV
jgi:hypothetical protein